MSKKSPKLVRQDLKFMTWEKNDKLITKGKFRPEPFTEVRPTYIHSLPQYDAKKKPELPIRTRHGENSFMEDYVHDWNILGGQLHYFTRVMNRSCWILLEWWE